MVGCAGMNKTTSVAEPAVAGQEVFTGAAIKYKVLCSVASGTLFFFIFDARILTEHFFDRL